MSGRWSVWVVPLLCLGCGGGGDEQAALAIPPDTLVCEGQCATASTFMATGDVAQVLARGIAEAAAQGVPATIAVVDRVGNVLAVYAMAGATPTVTVSSSATGDSQISGGLEGVAIVPSSLAAISKAITGAYLSSEGNAFSTRTASQIVQSHFNPGEFLAPGGPLFGVQFSQLPCSDLARRYNGSAPDAGPKRAPLGLAADAGGLPLYQSGTPVGGVGVVADRVYGLDTDPLDIDRDIDEVIALAASYGIATPEDRRADRITADGKTLRFIDARLDDLRSDPRVAPDFASLGATVGSLVAVPGYQSGNLAAGTAFGEPPSGVRPDRLDYAGLDAFVLVDETDTERFRPRAGTDVDALTAAEVTAIIRSGLGVARRARAQIRRPLGSHARVTVSVVDSTGVILGIARGRDGPIFGIDVSVQKARTAALFSGTAAAAGLATLPDAVYLDGGLTVLRRQPVGAYVVAAREFLGLPTALADGAIAYSARAVGNLARPFYPDGVDSAPHGPLSKAAGQWSPFSTGLQLDLVYNAIIQHVAFASGLAGDVAQQCTGVGGFDTGFAAGTSLPGLANGLQIFPGGVPIYRGSQLVGAIGVSGDGVDQDDMIGFLGLAEAGFATTGPSHADASIRADTLSPAGSRLRYVNCPQAPFLDSSEQAPCNER